MQDKGNSPSSLETTTLFRRDWLETQAILFVSFALALFIRIAVIADYGFSDDEVLKVLAVQSYRDLDFSANASHPALMKLAITLSVIIFGETEFAVRLPNVFIGALTVYPIYYLGSKLYSDHAGLLASFLWSVHLPAISFTTTAKEDTFLTFFWSLAVYFFIRAKEDPVYLRHSGICVGLAAASKFSAALLVVFLLLLFLLARREGTITLSPLEAGYLSIPLGVLTFIVASFPLLLPTTIVNLLDHYSPNTPEHTGWIMMEHLFAQRPPYYFLLHILVKTPVLFLLILAFGLLFTIKDRFTSDKILLLWIAIPLGFFSATTYGYVRYYLVIVPALVLLAVQGVFRFSLWMSSQFKKIGENTRPMVSFTMTSVVIALVCIHSILAAAEVSPYYRMYVNELGGGSSEAGYYFPQDSVYDYLMREAIDYIDERAPQGSVVALMVPDLGAYYGRSDLKFVSMLELPKDIAEWTNHNVSYVIVQDSRIFFENQDQIESIRNEMFPVKTYSIFDTVVAEVFGL